MAAPKKDEKEKLAPIVIKRIKKGGGGHHGGAWKVAYADFVTAMMAFFLLLWLLNVTTEEQKNAISNYFDPSHPRVSDVVSGAGGILGGMAVSVDGAMVSNVQPIAQPDVPDTTTRGEQQGTLTPEGLNEDKLAEELRAKEDERFNAAADKLKAEIAASPDLKDLQKNLLIDITPEGLRIQIVDDQGRSMFPSGSAKMYEFMHKLLLKVTSVVTPLPNQISVRGHTDSSKYKDPNAYDNWNLSADRAQASRRVMIEGKLPEKRIENVMGRSDREPLEKDPAAARNRRISIILLRERLTKDKIEKLKSDKANTAANEAARKAAEASAKPGLQIIDDTQPVKPAKATTVIPVDPNAPKPEYLQPQNVSPLPVTPPDSNFKAQPQVMYFGDDGKPKTDGPLYEGPVQAPIVVTPQKGPPVIHKKLFQLDDDAPEIKPAPALKVEPIAPAPAPAPVQKVISFGDPVPAPTQAAPANLPPAPVLELVNPTNPQVLEFGAVPAAPAAPTIPDLELVNPAQTPKQILNFGDSVVPAPQAAPQSNSTAPSSDKKELEF